MSETVLDTVGDRPNVFVSYSRRDRERAQRISDVLRARHFGVFRDTEDILPTEEWRERLEQLIAEADTIVFLLSPNSAASAVCAWEVEHAETLNKRIAPILIDEVDPREIPPRLARLNFIFCTERDRFEDAVDSLVSALTTDIDWIREHTRLGGLSARWKNAGRPARLLLRGQDIADAEAWRDGRPPEAPLVTPLQVEFVSQSRAAAARRQRRWIGGSLAAAAGALGLATVAWMQSLKAERQRGEAEMRRVESERNYATAKSAADNLLNEVANALGDVSDVAPETLREVFARSNEMYDQLLRSTADDPDVLKSKGKALASFALTFRDTADLEAAERAAREAIDTFGRLVEVEGHNPEWREQRALARVALLTVLGLDGRGTTAEARRILAEAGKELDALESGGHWSRQLAVARSTVHLARGLAAGEAGRHAEAAEHMRSGLGALDGVDPAGQGDDARNAFVTKRMLLKGLSHNLAETGDLAGAVAAAEEAVTLIDAALLLDPDRRELREALGEAWLARSDLARGEADIRTAGAAERRARHALFMAAPWHGDDPGALEQHAARALENAHAALRMEADPAAARDWYVTAAALSEEMIRRGSTDPDTYLRLSSALFGAEQTYPDDPDARLVATFETVTLTEELLAAEPSLVIFQALNRGRLGRQMLERGELEAAAESFDAAVAHFRVGTRFAPSDPELHRRLAGAQIDRGEVALRRNRPGAAIRSFQAARDTLREAAEIRPAIALDLAEAHVRLALAGDDVDENWRQAAEALERVPEAARTSRYRALAERLHEALDAD